MTTTVANLLDDPALGLRVLAGHKGLQREIRSPQLNRPGLELTGYFEAFRAERIQVLGNGEVSFIEKHREPHLLMDHLLRILGARVPCVIVTNGRQPPPMVIECADAIGVPALSCPHTTTKLHKRLWEHLDAEFAAESTLHGVLLDIHDIGVLLLGDSAVGKSECALELIRRGFHLVADDLVTVKCVGESALIGRATELLPYHMEARGIGIVDIRLLYGVAAVLPEKRITLAITLVEWDITVEYDRTGLAEDSLSILDVEIPHLTIPVRPGRNLGTLVEAAALNQKLKELGINTARLMEERLRQRLDANDPSCAASNTQSAKPSDRSK
ncbi:serine kinase of the HPr protein, regulates carbohydrate metabolism [Thioflavicoccus mobilis 8321]|uniref:HPr kinase/phosphorylase n=1 Tax=Thioflavicoccus mobilis 8321 TaxID=765912 RepID=L0GU71_9GAMM|nr:HPr(Ser) kinase/phosphatase [Thioflavicoccus mobilis]AGA88920.1 serine kinase of the HPr protein, regulates carbohydrate metabolism [Thioflavicoccus mobilis 8321]